MSENHGRKENFVVATSAMSSESSPLTSDVHRCLTGGDFLDLPGHSNAPETDSDNQDRAFATPQSASTDTDSLTQRVANLLNQTNYYNQDMKTPSQSGRDPATSDFDSASFFASSRLAPSNHSPSKITSLYQTASGTSFDDVVAPPSDFSDPVQKPQEGSSAAVQTLLKSLEWDHAWDVSAPRDTAKVDTSKTVQAAENERVESQRLSSSPKSQKRVLFDDDAVAMSSAKPRPSSPSRISPTSPAFSSAKYFSEMKNLVEEQLLRREALLQTDLKKSSTGNSNIDSSNSRTYLNPSYLSSSESSAPTARYTDYSSSYGFTSQRLPPPIFATSTMSTSNYNSRSGLADMPRSYSSRNYGTEASSKFSVSNSDLTTITPRTGSALSTNFYSHPHTSTDAFRANLHSRVADILAGRKPNYNDDMFRSTSSAQSGDNTTVESTHPGSNDAVPPAFPTNIYGNRPVSNNSENYSRYVRDPHSTLRYDHGVQTTSNLPGTVSSGIQTSAPTETKQTTQTESGIDLDKVASMLQEPIKAAVRKCLEDELKQKGFDFDEPRRPPSQTAKAPPPEEPKTSRSSSRNKARSPDRATSTTPPVDTLTSATTYIERMLETERRIAELSRLKAEEQAKRVKRLEEVLAEQTSNIYKPPAKFADKVEDYAKVIEEDDDYEAFDENREQYSRSSSPQSPYRSPVKSPVSWFVPAEKPKPKRRSRSKRYTPKSPVLLEYAPPDTKFLTNRIKEMLNPVSPAKPDEDISLQDALRVQNRKFIVRSSERLRRLRLHAIERKLSDERKKARAAVEIEQDEILKEKLKKIEEIQKQNEKAKTARLSKSKRPENGGGLRKTKSTQEMLLAELLACESPNRGSPSPEMRRIRAETNRKIKKLPEVVKRAEQDRKELQFKQNRMRAEIFKQKCLNKLLGRRKWSLPRSVAKDSLLDQLLVQ